MLLINNNKETYYQYANKPVAIKHPALPVYPP